MRYLLLATALWHTLAAYFFVLRAPHMLRAFTTETPASPVAADVLRFLGALNIGYAVLAAWGAGHPHPGTEISLALLLANGSQLAVNLYAHRTARWKPRLLGITLIDGFFTAAYAFQLAYLAYLAYLAD